ncbi:MAG: hypothetical protein LBO20_00965, partial [Bifidobacteriaceae bacterium]|nr:hypothetical protein [Bifidobacteriaceae bacterium]
MKTGGAARGVVVGLAALAVGLAGADGAGASAAHAVSAGQAIPGRHAASAVGARPSAGAAEAAVPEPLDPVQVSWQSATGPWANDVTTALFGGSGWLWTPRDVKTHTVWVRNASPDTASGEASLELSAPAGGVWDASVAVDGEDAAWASGASGQVVRASAPLGGLAPGQVARIDLRVRVAESNEFSPNLSAAAPITAQVVLSGGVEDPQASPWSAPGRLPWTGASGVGLLAAAGLLVAAGWRLLAAARRRSQAEDAVLR